LAEAHRRLLRAEGPQNWQVGIADHRALPLRTDEVDLVVSGWSIVYTVVWHEATWQHELGRALGEIERVLRPGGTVIILETMGTGYTTPNPPANLLPYFAYLECAGFASTWIRTDYAFANRQEASRIAGFFFGAEIAGQCVGDDPVILPECTGIWWKTFQEEA
jgi:ubiquinone/menaquinone biosynthesis C-methylase UbiE